MSGQNSKWIIREVNGETMETPVQDESGRYIARFSTEEEAELAIQSVNKLREAGIRPDQIQKMIQALAFFRSVILSGEPWGIECENKYNEAIK